MADNATPYVRQNGSATELDDFRIREAEDVEGYVRIDGQPVQFWPTDRFIDSFEEYENPNALFFNWTADGSGDTTLKSGGLVPNSTQCVRQTGTTELRSMVGDGLENYVELGETIEAYFRPQALGSRSYWILVNAEADQWSTTTETWRLEFLMHSGLRIVYFDGSSRNIRGSYDSDYTWNSNTTYRIEFQFSSNEIWVDVYAGVDSSNRVTWGSTTDVSSSELGDPMNIGLRSSSGSGECRWDWLRYAE